MILIIGGAYQGKLDYAKEKYGLTDEDIFDCKVNDHSIWPELNMKAKGINHFELFLLSCVKEGIETREYFMVKQND